ncbi:MAG: Preprotein translocase, SecG subunit [Candidatus Collierbacteria bacterium GW2011_GWA1_44_12]|uniref:Protein-export membrane protein SecG n=1 Tax=Candidatus Collierbacteria bacterium GW2011_GWA1_44_12 TaxID=1618376 RepID=A0A0G1IVJ7_9BACT|nr:MAG: Preprotein translocase, SecG subunit [Candidatus Collierbacteria bacterium GW2011_GWA1_44_12]
MQLTLILQIVVSIALIVLVTLQSKDSSLGSSFSSVTQSGFHTKRGPEKALYLVTIIVGLVFLVLSLLNILFAR